MFSPLRTVLCAVAALPLVASTAPAQAVSVGFHKSLGKHGSIQVGYESGHAGYGFGFGYHKPAYKQPYHKPVVFAPKPVVFAPKKVWVPGCYETVRQKVWVPGATTKVWVAPVYETRYDSCGHPYQVLVCAAHWETVQTPGCYQVQLVKVWKPAHWKYVD